jgi:hypothetical protein
MARDASFALLLAFQLFARCFPDDPPSSFDASCLSPSLVQVLPLPVPPASARLMLCR